MKDTRKGIKLRSTQWFELKQLYEEAWPLNNRRDIKTGDYIEGEYEPRGMALVDFLGLMFEDLNDGFHYCHKHKAEGVNRVKVRCPLCDRPPVKTEKEPDTKI